MKSFFNAVTKAKIVGNGTGEDLARWLERYCNILFPENRIEYFACDRAHFSRLPVPQAGVDDDCVRHVACYVRQGNESPIIEVRLVLGSGQNKILTWVKTFDKEDTCWRMAQAMSTALNSLIFYHELPEIVGMRDKLPRAYPWLTRTTLQEAVEIQTTPTHFRVSAGDLVLDDRDLSDVPSPHLLAEALAEDWRTVLKACGARIVEPATKVEVQPVANPPRVLVVVSGGVADPVGDAGVDVTVFDWDNYNEEEPADKVGVPARFADLAGPIGIPVEAV